MIQVLTKRNDVFAFLQRSKRSAFHSCLSQIVLFNWLNCWSLFLQPNVIKLLQKSFLKIKVSPKLQQKECSNSVIVNSF